MKVIRWRYAGDGEWIGTVDGVDVATAKKTGSALVPWGWTVHEPPALGAVDAVGVADTADAAMTAIAESIGATDGMYARFPYSRWHNPSYCDHCSDNGFVETPGWRKAWDLAARADDEERRLAPKPEPRGPFDPAVDPIEAGLAAVRYENVNGRRPVSTPESRRLARESNLRNGRLPAEE